MVSFSATTAIGLTPEDGSIVAMVFLRVSALCNKISLWDLRIPGRTPSFSFKPHFAVPASGLSEVHGLDLLVTKVTHKEYWTGSHPPFSRGPPRLPFMRPELECRTFRSDHVEVLMLHEHRPSLRIHLYFFTRGTSFEK